MFEINCPTKKGMSRDLCLPPAPEAKSKVYMNYDIKWQVLM